MMEVSKLAALMIIALLLTFVTVVVGARLRGMRASNAVSKVIAAVEDKLPARDIEFARELVEHREWGLALETVCTQLHEFDVAIPRSSYSLVRSAGQQMDMDSRVWESLNVSDQQADAPIAPSHLQPNKPASDHGTSHIAAKYRDLYAAGQGPQQIAVEMVRDDYGKILAITALRQFFGLSLKDAVKIHDDAERGS